MGRRSTGNGCLPEFRSKSNRTLVEGGYFFFFAIMYTNVITSTNKPAKARRSANVMYIAASLPSENFRKESLRKRALLSDFEDLLRGDYRRR